MFELGTQGFSTYGWDKITARLTVLNTIKQGQHIEVFSASRGLSQRGKMKQEERDLCQLLTSCLMKPPTKFLVETYRFSKPVSFNV